MTSRFCPHWKCWRFVLGVHKRARWGVEEGEERMMWNRQNERDKGSIGRQKMISVDHVMEGIA